MTPSPGQLIAILDSVRNGVPFPRACRAAGTTPDTVRSHARREDAFAVELEAAEADGGAAASLPAPSPPPERSDANPTALDADKIAREAAEHAPGPFGFLLWQEQRLFAHGYHPLSEWWRYDLERFYASKKRWHVVSAGRGGGKSTVLTRVATVESLTCERIVPPGQLWIWPFISVASTDAHRRVRDVEVILSAWGIVPARVTRASNPTIELCDIRGNTIAFVSLASTIAGVSGPNTIGATIDEEAKLRDGAGRANPSTEILMSLTQTFRAREGIRAIRCSSAWTPDGSHAQSIAEGDTSTNHVARVGPQFVQAVVQGLLSVAAWEESDRDGKAQDHAAGKRIREYTDTITAQTTAIPTWLGNPTITAVKSRVEVDALPVAALGGVPRSTYWLRENASVPMTAHGGGRYAPFTLDDAADLKDANREIADRAPWRPPAGYL